MLVRRLRSLIAPTALALLVVACAASPQAPASSQDSSELRSSLPADQGSCWDQCAAATSDSCLGCGPVSPDECAIVTAECFDSCDRGVGPWLPC